MQTLAFGNCADKLEHPTFDAADRLAALSVIQSFHVAKRLPWLPKLMKRLPDAISQRLNPPIAGYLRQARMSEDKTAQLATMSEENFLGAEIIPVFRTLMKSDKLPDEEKTVKRIGQEAQMMLMAGTLTMSSSLEHLLYWMISNPEVLHRLKEELLTVMPLINDVGTVPLATLEALPYLSAVIKEGVRLIYGNSTPLFRVDPDSPLVYTNQATGEEWVIPPKTPVAMTAALLHHNEEHFPDSHKFIPERWLGEEGKKLDKYNVGFGKGSRACLGQNQAQGITRLVLAGIWRLWATRDVMIGDEIGVLELHDTTAHDVALKGDMFVAAYNKSQGVEFKVSSL
ncbi:cytochrome P450 [Xylariaceae sp. FL1019]|nr:cytochrome P450 [Xylariaceae sp. FL1019]